MTGPEVFLEGNTEEDARRLQTNNTLSSQEESNEMATYGIPAGTDIVVSSVRSQNIKELIGRICESLDTMEDTGQELNKKQQDDRTRGWISEAEDALADGGESVVIDGVVGDADLKEVDDFFKEWERKESSRFNLVEFEKIEAFVLDEQNSGRHRRSRARRLESAEELRLQAEVAELKAYRNRNLINKSADDVRAQIVDAEKSFVNRKMVVSRAHQIAMSDCRQQFARVRAFFQRLHDSQMTRLHNQFKRASKLQGMLHALTKKDQRVRNLERSAAERIFKKRQQNLQELNMFQNLEEAKYLESMVDLLEGVQQAKFVAAEELFKLRIRDLKEQQTRDENDEKELSDFRADALLKSSKLLAERLEIEVQDQEEDNNQEEGVMATERRKDFHVSFSKAILSVSDLYDTILWSVATSSIGLSSSDESDSFASSMMNEEDDDYDEEPDADEVKSKDNYQNPQANQVGDTPDKDTAEHMWTNDSSSVKSGSTANTGPSMESDKFSPVSNMLFQELKRSIRDEEKKMVKRQKLERKKARRAYKTERLQLKTKHKQIVESILANCVNKRHELRDAIAQRMAQVEQRQQQSTMSLQEEIEADVSAMRDAWGEHKRLEEEQKSSFAKAQALISAQVFHEVRNALSSVVAVSEITSSLQNDPTVTSDALVSSVHEMLGQNKEVVNYSLNMLNNILDVSKIKAGSFETNKSLFDLQDLVNRATKMQQVKAQTRGVKMSFEPMAEPQIAITDDDILVRIVTNFISNAVKFTEYGAIQPFVCPLKSIDPKNKMIRQVVEEILPGHITGGEGQVKRMKMVAVGVADTGPGLSKELLAIAKEGLFSSDNSKLNSGAKNSGFGLHLAHQLAGTLGTELHLTDLESFSESYSVDMKNVLMDDDRSSVKSGSSSYQGPGPGTVLYITIPVLDNGQDGLALLNGMNNHDQGQASGTRDYVFSPRPAIDARGGCFRVLIADDVTMLRKGLMRSILDIFSKFSDCPVSVSTACTAEDALRAVGAEQFDLFICDHQFAPPSHHHRVRNPSDSDSDEERKNFRPHVNIVGDRESLRKAEARFFAEEEFTVEPGDGSLSGCDALCKLSEAANGYEFFKVPILMLHSGHELVLPPEKGIVVIRKPLKRTDFVPLFEANASLLIDAGVCVEVEKEGKCYVYNQAGARIFERG